jgi:hypothetical protein
MISIQLKLPQCYSQKSGGNLAVFTLFTHDHKIDWVITFGGKFFLNFFTEFDISIKFCVFDTLLAVF